jgi:hypothetical protein
MKKIAIIFLLLAALGFNLLKAHAETILLKTGQIISGKVFEKGADYVKVEVSGTLITYYLDEIQSINDADNPSEASIKTPKTTQPIVKKIMAKEQPADSYKTQVYKPEGWMVFDGNSKFFQDNPIPGITPLFLLARELNVTTSSIVIIGVKPNPDGITAQKYVDSLNANPEMLQQQHSKLLEIVNINGKPMAKQIMEISQEESGLSIMTQTYYYFDQKSVFLIQITGFPEIIAGQQKEINSILESVKF